jgi:hypothetical protein
MNKTYRMKVVGVFVRLRAPLPHHNLRLSGYAVHFSSVQQ